MLLASRASYPVKYRNLPCSLCWTPLGDRITTLLAPQRHAVGMLLTGIRRGLIPGRLNQSVSALAPRRLGLRQQRLAWLSGWENGVVVLRATGLRHVGSRAGPAAPAGTAATAQLQQEQQPGPDLATQDEDTIAAIVTGETTA